MQGFLESIKEKVNRDENISYPPSDVEKSKANSAESILFV